MWPCTQLQPLSWSASTQRLWPSQSHAPALATTQPVTCTQPNPLWCPASTQRDKSCPCPCAASYEVLSLIPPLGRRVLRYSSCPVHLLSGHGERCAAQLLRIQAHGAHPVAVQWRDGSVGLEWVAAEGCVIAAALTGKQQGGRWKVSAKAVSQGKVKAVWYMWHSAAVATAAVASESVVLRAEARSVSRYAVRALLRIMSRLPSWSLSCSGAQAPCMQGGAVLWLSSAVTCMQHRLPRVILAVRQ